MTPATTILVNASDLMPPQWRFVEPLCDLRGLAWRHVSGQPANAVERRVRRPNLARWRAALQTCRLARQAPDRSVLLTHLPLMTMAAGLLRRGLCPGVPHVAFAFNFTRLPQGLRHRLIASACRGVSEFVVFSRFEVGLYARLLDIPPERLRFLHWAMDPPRTAPSLPAGLPAAPFLCAIGGEGRDYATLAAAMARLPGLRMVVVGRPHALAGIAFPSNVTVLANLPSPQTWAIAAASRGMALPLASAETACGHVTLVGAQHLGIPLAITRSAGVADYVTNDTALLLPPNDPAALAEALIALAEDPAAPSRAARARAEAAHRSDPVRWAAWVADLATRHAAGDLPALP